MCKRNDAREVLVGVVLRRGVPVVVVVVVVVVFVVVVVVHSFTSISVRRRFAVLT